MAELMRLGKTFFHDAPLCIVANGILRVNRPDRVLFVSSTVLRNHPNLVHNACERPLKPDDVKEYVRAGLVIMIAVGKSNDE